MGSKMAGWAVMAEKPSTKKKQTSGGPACSAAAHLDHVLYMLQARQQPSQLLQFPYPHGELHMGIFATTLGIHAQHVEPVLGDDVGHVAQQTLPVEGLEANVHLEGGICVEHPFRWQHAGRIGTLERGAVVTIHKQTTPNQKENNKNNKWLRRAATGQRQRHVAQARK